MKTIEGYSKEKYTNTDVLLAGGGAKPEGDLNVSNADTTDGYHLAFTSVGPFNSSTSPYTYYWYKIGRPSSFAAYDIIVSGDKNYPYHGHYTLTMTSYYTYSHSFNLFCNGKNSTGNLYIAADLNYVYIQFYGQWECWIKIKCILGTDRFNKTAVGNAAAGTVNGFTAVTPVYKDAGSVKIDISHNTYGYSDTPRITANLDGTANLANQLVLTFCSSSSNNGLWNTIKNSSSNSKTNRVTFYTIYNNGGPTTYGEMMEILSVNANHWQPQLWFGAGKGAHLYYRNKDYANDTWGDWLTIIDSGNIGSQSVNYAASAGSVAWGDVTSKPDSATRWPTWNEVTSKPSSFTPSSHDHERILPTRHDSDAPSPKAKGKSLTFQFSYFDNDWWNVLNMRSYDDYNYMSAQLLSPAGNPGSDTGYGDLYWRQGRQSTWIAKRKILDSNNYTTYCATADHTHSKLVSGYGVSDEEDKALLFAYRISTSTSGVPATTDNSNAVLTINRHDGGYSSQIGFGSDGRIKYRSYSNQYIANNVTKAWNTLAYTSEIPTWDTLSGKPSTFPPSSHTHDYAATSHTHTVLYERKDARSDSPTPTEANRYGRAVYFDFVSADGPSGQGTYSAGFFINPWNGSAGDSDWSGGGIHELRFNQNGKIYHRVGDGSGWGAWTTVMKTGDTVSYADSAGSASYADSAGSASSANKVANSLSWTNASGSTQTFNGSSAVTINGIYTAYNATNATYVQTTKSTSAAWRYLTFVDSNNDSAASETVYTNNYLQYYPSSGGLKCNFITLKNDGTTPGGLYIDIDGGYNIPINASTSSTPYCIYAVNSNTHSNTFTANNAVIAAYGSGYHYDILAPWYTSKFGGLELGMETSPEASDSTSLSYAQKSSIYYVNSDKTVYLPTTYARNGRILFIINDGNHTVTFQASGKTIKYFRRSGSRTDTDTSYGEGFQCIYICIYYNNTWYIAPTDMTN